MNEIELKERFENAIELIEGEIETCKECMDDIEYSNTDGFDSTILLLKSLLIVRNYFNDLKNDID